MSDECKRYLENPRHGEDIYNHKDMDNDLNGCLTTKDKYIQLSNDFKNNPCQSAG